MHACIAISPITGEVYITDWNNHCVHVLNSDLTFSCSFGEKGSANGQFCIYVTLLLAVKD